MRTIEEVSVLSSSSELLSPSWYQAMVDGSIEILTVEGRIFDVRGAAIVATVPQHSYEIY
jgi:hypothetical protein